MVAYKLRKKQVNYFLGEVPKNLGSEPSEKGLSPSKKQLSY